MKGETRDSFRLSTASTIPNVTCVHVFFCFITSSASQHHSPRFIPHMFWIESNASNWTCPNDWDVRQGPPVSNWNRFGRAIRDLIRSPNQPRPVCDEMLVSSRAIEITSTPFHLSWGIQLLRWAERGVKKKRKEKKWQTGRVAEIKKRERGRGKERAIRGKNSWSFKQKKVACPKSCAVEHIRTIKAFRHTHSHTYTFSVQRLGCVLVPSCCLPFYSSPLKAGSCGL